MRRLGSPLRRVEATLALALLVLVPLQPPAAAMAREAALTPPPPPSLVVDDRTGLQSPEIDAWIAATIARRWPLARSVTLEELDTEIRGHRDLVGPGRIRPRGLPPVADAPVTLWLRLSVWLPTSARPLRLFGRTMTDPQYAMVSAVRIARRPWGGDHAGTAPRDPWLPYVALALDNALAFAPRAR